MIFIAKHIIMKRLFYLSLALSLTTLLCAQDNKQHDWAQFYRYQEQNKQIMQSEEFPLVVFMGNSITDHWAQLHPQFFANHNYVARGISGQTSSEMLVRFQADVIDLTPRVVIILAGANDIAQNNGYISEEHILQNIKSMCELAQAHGIQPAVCSITPSNHFSWRPDMQPAQAIISMNKKLKLYAQQSGLCYIDYWSALAETDGSMKAEYTTDGCHLNEQGYQVMEKVVLKALQQFRLTF